MLQIVLGIIVAVIVLSLLPAIIAGVLYLVPILIFFGALIYLALNPESLIYAGGLAAGIVVFIFPFYTLSRLNNALKESGGAKLWWKSIKLRLTPALTKPKKDVVRSELKLLANEMHNERRKREKELTKEKEKYKNEKIEKEAIIVERKIKRIANKFWRTSELSVDKNENSFYIYSNDGRFTGKLRFKFEIYLNIFLSTKFIKYRSHYFKYTVFNNSDTTYGENFDYRGPALSCLKKTIRRFLHLF